MKAVFSIHPRYVRLIFDGKKGCEYRRNLPVKPITDIVIYATFPVSKVVGEARVDGLLLLEKELLWQKTCGIGGITREEFEGYFCGKETAGALLLSHPMVFDQPLPVSELGLVRPPQSFCYLGEKNE